MKKTILFHIFKGEKQYVAEGTDLPIVTQGKTLDELMANLKEAIALHFDENDISKYDFAPHPTFLANMEFDIADYAKA